MSKFSIITITKDNPDGLARTRRSVESQSFKNYEWIVIDGAAEPDNGIYDAMNKGLDRASGEYVIFMNAGDCFAGESVLDSVARFRGDMIYGDAIEAGHLKKSRHHTQIAKGMITHHQAIFYRRAAVKGLRYDESYPIAADYKFTIEVLAKADCVASIPAPLCIFETGGVSQRRAKQGRAEQIAIRRALGLPNGLTPYRQFWGCFIKEYFSYFYYLYCKL